MISYVKLFQRERQMRRDEATRIAQLERMVQSGGGGGNDYGLGSSEGNLGVFFKISFKACN